MSNTARFHLSVFINQIRGVRCLPCRTSRDCSAPGPITSRVITHYPFSLGGGIASNRKPRFDVVLYCQLQRFQHIHSQFRGKVASAKPICKHVAVYGTGCSPYSRLLPPWRRCKTGSRTMTMLVAGDRKFRACARAGTWRCRRWKRRSAGKLPAHPGAPNGVAASVAGGQRGHNSDYVFACR